MFFDPIIKKKMAGYLRRGLSNWPCYYRPFSIRIPVFHIASMPRSGETVLLRSLNRHSRLVITHNLKKNDEKYENDLFQYLMKYRWKKINLHCALLNRYNANRDSILILKQSVWKHKYKFNGVILVRNPVSVYASLRVYDMNDHGNNPDFNWETFRIPSFISWLEEIEPGYIPEFLKMDPIDQFCGFYNLRMQHLASLGLPVVYYEKFVNNPEGELRRICRYMKIDFERAMIDPENTFDNRYGHGNIDLTRRIDNSSLYKYRDILGKADAEDIIKKTDPSLKLFHYSLDWDNIGIMEKE